MRVTIWDIEATDLAASWGRILCASFVDLDGDVETLRGDDKGFRGRSKVDDLKLAVAIRDRLEDSDMIVGWNSILYDQPMLNARLMKGGERPLRIGEAFGLTHLDLMYYAGGQSNRIGGRKLDTVAKYLGVQHQKTPLNGETWQLAGAGDKKALDLVVEHCEADVLVLRDIWPHLVKNVKKHSFTLSEVHPWITEIPSRRRAS